MFEDAIPELEYTPSSSDVTRSRITHCLHHCQGARLSSLSLAAVRDRCGVLASACRHCNAQCNPSIAHSVFCAHHGWMRGSSGATRCLSRNPSRHVCASIQRLCRAVRIDISNAIGVAFVWCGDYDEIADLEWVGRNTTSAFESRRASTA
jgi:hypothetical protein